MTYRNKYKKLLSLCALFVYTVQADTCNKKSCCPTPSNAAICTPVTVDYIIVGNGTAGATLARFLSDQVDGKFVNNVLVLEAGPNLSSDPGVLQTDLVTALRLGLSSKYGKNFATFTGPFVQFGTTANLYIHGELWGGSSAINGLLAVRGTPGLYGIWAIASNNAQWTYSNLLPVMKFLEHYTGTSQLIAERGTNGNLYINQNPFGVTQTNPFNIALSAISGSAILEDYNVTGADVVISSAQNWINDTVMPNVRSFSANAFLTSDVVTSAGTGVGGRLLNILSEAQVTHILFDTSGAMPVAVGVEYIVNGNKDQVFRVYATKKVILCAGAIENIGVLERSGIGQPTVLENANIQLLVASPLVGENLQTYYGISAITAGNPQSVAPPLTVQEAYIDLRGFNGFAADGVRRVQLLYEGDPFLFGSPTTLLALGFTNLPSLIDNSNSFGISIMNPKSRGSVHVPNNDPLILPVTDFNLYSDSNGLVTPDSDAAEVVAALKVVRAAVQSQGGGLDMIYPTPAQYASDADLLQAAFNLPFIQYHAVGTCKMGTDITNGVVDGNLNVFGVQNLMIADCSIEPQIEDGNTAYAAYLIGAVAARILGSQTVPAA
jgi:choline dehydrogenase